LSIGYDCNKSIDNWDLLFAIYGSTYDAFRKYSNIFKLNSIAALWRKEFPNLSVIFLYSNENVSLCLTILVNINLMKKFMFYAISLWIIVVSSY